jgi:hypothetical protein
MPVGVMTHQKLQRNLVECFLIELGKNQSATFFIAKSNKFLDMMLSIQRGPHLEYIKFILGIGALFGILILISQINASFQS